MRRTRELARGLVAVCIAFAHLPGCTLIGPDYVRPAAPTGTEWIAAKEGMLRGTPVDPGVWWTVFEDPVLDTLVETAYRQNPSLHAAGVRVAEAQARRGIAIGGLFPQRQDAFGSVLHAGFSENRANQGAAGFDAAFDDYQFGFDAAWELDIWGRFRRGIEAADAELLAALASYDDVLVSLVAEVAANYVFLRTFEERLAVARSNVAIQRRSYEIANEKFLGGAVTELDAVQAASLLYDTEASIPALEANIRQVENTLCILLGIPPRDLRDLLGEPGDIPDAPAEVAVGVPADLLRRRPDVRRAERLLAAQSAQIGIAKSDLLPRLSLIGNLSLAAEDFADLFKGDSFESFGGPTFRWAILNYGRITNNVRVQDARYQALVGDYEAIVLRAQAEAENAMAAFLGARRQVALLAESVRAATRAVELATFQYREGAVDYTRVLDTQQFLVVEEDRLVDTEGDVAFSLTALYKALGGGWELRIGQDLIPEDDREEMPRRTRWGNMLGANGQRQDVEAAGSGTEGARGWWRWHSWWPKW